MLEKIKNEATVDGLIQAFGGKVDASQDLVQKQIEQIEKERGIQDMQTMSEMTRMSRQPALQLKPMGMQLHSGQTIQEIGEGAESRISAQQMVYSPDIGKPF